jgi:hypothetical protein
MRCTDVLQCYFYHIADPESHNSNLELIAHWELPMPKIHTLAMSQDGQYAAFVLFADTMQHRNGSLYITRLNWLQAANPKGCVYCSHHLTIILAHHNL